MENVRTFLSRLYDTFIVPIKDFRPLGWVAFIVALLYWLDPQGLSVMRVILYTFLFWMLSLSLRKAMMPYRKTDEDGKKTQMKLSDFLRAALDGNLAAGIVGAAILGFQAILALSFILWLR